MSYCLEFQFPQNTPFLTQSQPNPSFQQLVLSYLENVNMHLINNLFHMVPTWCSTMTTSCSWQPHISIFIDNNFPFSGEWWVVMKHVIGDHKMKELKTLIIINFTCIICSTLSNNLNFYAWNLISYQNLWIQTHFPFAITWLSMLHCGSTY